jgi:3-keto-disaccharide hydrolase
MTRTLKVSVALATMCLAASAALAETPKKSPAWRDLLDAKMSNFDVWLSYRGDQILSVIKGTAPDLKPVGLNPPGQTVFTVRNEGEPVLRVSGEYYGCLVTRESFSNYHFRVQFKWGDKKWEPRLDEPRDSGILYHTSGPYGVDYWKSWALSHEFQIIEHGLGEYWTQATSAMTIRATAGVAGAQGADAPRWSPDAPWTQFVPPNNHALAGSDEDKPGEWNQLDLICVDDRCLHIANGKVVMALKNARYKDGERWVPMTGGKLQFQSESAEVFYRRFQIRPQAAIPREYAKYFD